MDTHLTVLKYPAKRSTLSHKYPTNQSSASTSQLYNSSFSSSSIKDISDSEPIRILFLAGSSSNPSRLSNSSRLSSRSSNPSSSSRIALSSSGSNSIERVSRIEPFRSDHYYARFHSTNDLVSVVPETDQMGSVFLDLGLAPGPKGLCQTPHFKMAWRNPQRNDSAEHNRHSREHRFASFVDNFFNVCPLALLHPLEKLVME
ncbi:hypothetical protein PSACC_01983 [Paramicrosporidium saccamoebae]|uniref:Uncharacterized protein n=1 Tax=Paramicrosporidium saccamoebae TaxID=1246581 RepID=A0A2H9TKC2_9FUNG|nr:hypothetical protein PSACC_01983 [Paramicrosporidium saccamoebae]